MQTAAASLVAAVPALVLALVLVMGILNFGTGGGNWLLQVAIFGTLASAVTVALLPGLIFVFWDRKPVVAAESAGQSQTMAVSEDDAGVSVGDDGIGVVEGDDTEVAETVDFDTASLPADATEEDSETSEMDDADLFVDDEDEEEAKPKKKKR